MNEDELELFKEKMCTKICQLTRVVYLLNNKYLDSQAMIDAIKDSYETEIQNVTREANLVIGKLKKQIEELKCYTKNSRSHNIDNPECLTDYKKGEKYGMV